MMDIEFGKRKVHKTGGSFMIVLPRAWARTVSLERGARVAVKMTGHKRLVIEPPDLTPEEVAPA